MEQKQILLTNDDGIRSPGLWAAAEALSALGYVHVVAPREQFTGAGRSLPTSTDGVVSPQQMVVNGKNWTVYAVGASPAQAVMHAMFEILPTKPDLTVSGINFGENVGSGVTISGTVGAALESAANGVPGMAVSLEVDPKHHYASDTTSPINFSVAAYFTAMFASKMLQKRFPEDVDVLKVEVPCDANARTPWKVTRLSKVSYYLPFPQERHSWDEPRPVLYRQNPEANLDRPGTDVYTLCVERQVSVTPLSLDLTSRTNLQDLENDLRNS
jgi:5'-nucleotidase